MWTQDDVEQAVAGHELATQARWTSSSLVLLLWQWALNNRKTPFYSALDKNWSQIRKAGEMLNIELNEDPVSPPALTKVRQKLGTVPLRRLHATACEKHLEKHDALIRLKKYRLYAVDGSSLNLRSTKNLVSAFGRPGSSDNDRMLPQAMFTALELVNTGWIMDYCLTPCNGSELGNSKQLTANLGLGDLLLGDRLYFDAGWYFDLITRMVHFLFRINKNRFKSLTAKSQQKIKEIRKAGNVDCWVELKVKRKGKTERLLKVRYIEIHREGMETLFFMTNLSNDELSTKEAAQLYSMRWEIETDFRFFKGANHDAVVLSRKEDTVRQEVLVRVMAHNSVRFVQSEACLKKREEEREIPKFAPVAGQWNKKSLYHNEGIRPVDLSYTRTISLTEGYIFDALLFPENSGLKQWHKLLERVGKAEINAKPNRSFPRKGAKYNKGKRNKGDVNAQKIRKKQRDQLSSGES